MMTQWPQYWYQTLYVCKAYLSPTIWSCDVFLSRDWISNIFGNEWYTPNPYLSVQKRHEIRFYSILLLGDSRYWHIFQFTQSFYWEDCYYKDKMVTGSKIKTCLHSRYIENYGAGPSARNEMATKYRPCFLQNSDLDIGWFKYVKRHHSKRWRDSASADHKK